MSSTRPAEVPEDCSPPVDCVSTWRRSSRPRRQFVVSGSHVPALLTRYCRRAVDAGDLEEQELWVLSVYGNNYSFHQVFVYHVFIGQLILVTSREMDFEVNEGFSRLQHKLKQDHI
ncbi:hypothetical protein NDU88_001303 [Pleurodeles waltl]|uniref:Uncharacterized protein n=1 Tax=Pleurodeles waltl TaxID=8319 RepID=A0AAV7V821_PLEWA|nr:hypothetical protein NDU88_001303 [Pleurodeles waltl]